MIEIINQQNKHRIHRKKFKNLLKKLVEHYKLKEVELSLVFVDTKTIRQLNKRFLKKDAPTDVLSFSLGEKGADGKFYLGDIIISVSQAFRKSSSPERSLDAKLELLAIHGFLHLMGFEHSAGIEEEEEKIRNLFLNNSK
jgi:probable rRNA maturation factor